MVVVTLYTCSSEPLVVSKELSQVVQLLGVLREPSSVTNPVIKIELGDPIGCNYAHISEFNRYYFIDDIISIRSGLWELHLRVDVLMSFAVDIRRSEAIIEETASQAAGGNMYLSNDAFVAQVKHKTDIVQFPQGFTDTPYFILITAGGVVS